MESKICSFSSATADLLVDVSGYFPTTGSKSGSYTRTMNAATSGLRVEVGVCELKNGLSHYLDRVAGGTEQLPALSREHDGVDR